MPAPSDASSTSSTRSGGGQGSGEGTSQGRKRRRRRRGGQGNRAQSGENRAQGGKTAEQPDQTGKQGNQQQKQGRGQQEQGQQKGRAGGQGGSKKKGRSRRRKPQAPISVTVDDLEVIELDEAEMDTRRGQYKDGNPLGRYQMMVHVDGETTHISVLEGRSLVEHYVSRPADEVSQIHGNIYAGRVENVLPGMEAAFVDIDTPKNAVLYRSDITWDPSDLDGVNPGDEPRIEQVLKNRQIVLCQVTKNPIGHKGARLTQEVSVPGRFVVFVPNSDTVGISKRLPDAERKRLRKILNKARPKGHGLIVRTAAENVTASEIQRDIQHLSAQWQKIAEMAQGQQKPRLIYREPPMAVRMIREEFSSDFRNVTIDDPELFEEIRSYAAAVAPALAERVKLYDTATEPLPLLQKMHVSEQITKVLDRKVWLPSGGSLIIETTEALTVVDVNTGKNVGSSSLEETVFNNNLEAADETARQLRLRDIGGIIVIDFVDMEVKQNRDQVFKRFKQALSADKTRTQVFPISELGLVEMTRKRIGEGLLNTLAEPCEHCHGRGMIVPERFLR